jgi:hypothetical protein
MQCAAHNAQKKPCGNLAVPGGLYCASHQPQAGDEYPEAEEEEELDAESRLTMAARRVGSHVEEATTVAEVGRRLMGAFDVLLQMTSEQVTGGVEAIREMVEVIASDRDELRRDLDFLLADFNLDEEQRQLLAAQAVQNGQSMGELLSSLVSERLTWDEDSIACLIDPNISIRVKELAHGRSTEPSAVINGALQYCIENEAL